MKSAERAWLWMSLLLGSASILVALTLKAGFASAGLTCAAGVAVVIALRRSSVAGGVAGSESAEPSLAAMTTEELEAVLLADTQAFSHTGAWEVDLATGLGSWSAEMYLVCGLTPASGPRGQEDILSVVYPQDRRKLMQATERSGKDLKPFEVRHRITWPDGSLRSCVTRGKVLQAAGGRPPRLVGTTQDLTDQVRMEESLQDAEARFQAFMDHSPFSAWMRDRSGQFVYCNERFAEHMGLQAHEIMGSDQSASWFSREYVERAKRDDQRVLESGRSSENIEHVPLRDGSIRHWLVLKFPIQSHSGETVVGGVALDLTSRYSAEEKLRASEKRLRSIMESASEGIAVTDSESKVTSWNKAAETIFGYTEEEAIGKQPDSFLSETGLEEYSARLAAFPDGARPFVVHGLRKNGEEFALELSRSAWQNGTQRFFTTILRDVTERRRLEEQLRQEEQATLRASEAAALETSRLKSEFLAHMSHEIRTPINGVIGMSDLLIDTRLDQEQHSYADAIQRSARGLLDIINDILDFSKIEAGKLEVEQIDFELARVFEDTEKMLIYQARGKGLELSLVIERDVPTGLRGDPGRLRQVLGNLISNAIKFTSTGRVQVRASRESNGGPADPIRVRFEVTDTGIGLTGEARERLFQPFAQADSSTSRHYGGTGLGLSICKGLVERMGGEIGVRSSEGVGSTFWFTMPFAPGLPARTSAGRAGQLPAPFKGRASWVLVAEDNLINQTILLKQLEKNGIHADAASNGQEVLAALEAKHYDLLLMDCQMPGMDGYEATARIRSLKHASYHAIPIVAVTANAVKGDREKCLSLGMNDYISKPVHPVELNRVLSQWLKDAEGDTTMTEKVSVLERRMIEELRALDDGQGHVLKQLIEMFVEGVPGRIAAIAKAHSEGDLKTLNNEAHSLKSSAANLGAHHVSALCLKLEHAKTPEAAAALADIPAQLQREFEKARAELRSAIG